MSKERQDEQSARIIWHDALQNSIKPLTWGIRFGSVKAIKNGTSFHVEKIRGVVSIECHKGIPLYRVNIKPDDSKKPIVYENVKLENLVHTIDQVLTLSAKYNSYGCLVNPDVRESLTV